MQARFDLQSLNLLRGDTSQKFNIYQDKCLISLNPLRSTSGGPPSLAKRLESLQFLPLSRMVDVAVLEDDTFLPFDQIPVGHEEQGTVVIDCPKRKGVYTVAGYQVAVSNLSRRRPQAGGEVVTVCCHVCNNQKRENQPQGTGTRYRFIWDNVPFFVCFSLSHAYIFISFIVHFSWLQLEMQQGFNHVTCAWLSLQNVAFPLFRINRGGCTQYVPQK